MPKSSGADGSRQIAPIAAHRSQMKVDLLAALIDRLLLPSPPARTRQQENQAAYDKGGATDDQRKSKSVHCCAIQ